MGDVAETGGSRMASAGFFQTETILQNIYAMIRGQIPSRIYKPCLVIEGRLKLSLGKVSFSVSLRNLILIDGPG